MWGQVATNCLRQFRDLPGWLLCRLLLLAFLACIVQKRAFQCLGHEVSVDSVLVDAGCGENLFEMVTGVAWLDELLFRGLWFRLDDGDVF